MATIALGIAMVDEFLETRPKPSVDKRIISSTQVRLQIKSEWVSLTIRKRIFLIVMNFVVILTIFEVLVFHRIVLSKILSIIYDAYSGISIEPINFLFKRFAERSNQVAVEEYMWKTARLYWSMRLFVSISIAFLSSILTAQAFKYRTFMSFIMTTMALGIAKVDNFLETRPRPIIGKRTFPSTQVRLRIKSEWVSLTLRKRIFLIVMNFVAVLIILEILVFHRIVLSKTLSIIYDAYNGTSIDPINFLSKRFADRSNQVVVEEYMWRTAKLYWSMRLVVSIGIAFLSSIITAQAFKYRTYLLLGNRFNRLILVSAFLLGLTSSIRILGPFAGILVSTYFFLIRRKQALKPLLIYWGVAAAMFFVTRPYFWKDSINRILGSIDSSTSFQWLGTIRFQGNLYTADEVPTSYAPHIILNQLTEPLILLAMLGLILAVWHFYKKSKERIILLIVFGWIIIPTITSLLLDVTFYDNFRQLFFIIPPVLIFAGFGVEGLFYLLKPRILRFVFIVILILPGAINIVKLHPYEYIYYNLIVGGVSRAYMNYELDYWCTSCKEEMEFVNSEAPLNARVVAWGPVKAARTFARSDLIVLSEGEIGSGPDYAIACGAALYYDNYYQGYEVPYEVVREGAVIGRVKRRPESP